MDSGETESASGIWSRTVLLFVSGVFFGTLISAMLLYWKSSLIERKFRALLGLGLGLQGTDSADPLDCDIIQDSPSEKEDTGSSSTHPNINQDSTSSQEGSTSTHTQRVYKYDVFLSFRGEDTRTSFVDHLYNHLISKGIFIFKDDNTLLKGQQLLQPIRDSRVSIVVFSRNYASSTWCLEEMAAIFDCHNELKQAVFPVFYEVEPSQVRRQTGPYEDAFVLHTEKFKEDADKVYRWKRAMMSLANLTGWVVSDKQEFAVIEYITQEVMDRLGRGFSRSSDDLVGIQPNVECVEKLLKLSSDDDDFRVLGICGMGGVGKTTLARVLYNRIFHLFDASCFIVNVNGICRYGSAIDVQKQILLQTFDQPILETYSPFEISVSMRRRLSRIRVLIVLDNVGEIEQLEKTVISPELLGRRSRIIITTRDEHILKVYGADCIYRVPLLNYNDANKLFSREAFDSDSPIAECVELIPEILECAQGLPLTIKVLGSYFRAQNAAQWKYALMRLREKPDNQIMDVLRISYDNLSMNEKHIFLHIACFFHGEREEQVRRILDSCGLHSAIGIYVIMEKSLVTINNKKIDMHQLLQELGRNIVQQESPQKPGLRSRLWCYEDFANVLSSEAETNNFIEAIVLNHKEDVWKGEQLRIEGLSKMRNLKLLILYHHNFSGRLEYLSNNLRYLFWHGYPFSSLPLFEPYSRLVELNLPKSRIKRLWEGDKDFPRLERVDLSNSEHLEETPNFEGSPNLKYLDLTGCTNLRLVNPSIALLTKLVYLSLQDCIHLVSLDLDTRQCKLSSLRVLLLSGCTKLERTPDFTGLLNLEYLDIEQCTSLFTMHESIGTLTTLKFLSLRGCSSLAEIPYGVSCIPSLQTLDLSCCINLKNLPQGQQVVSSSKNPPLRQGKEVLMLLESLGVLKD